MRRRALLLNLLLAAASTVVCLLFLEAAARIARGPAVAGKEQRTRTLYHDYDPVLGWRKRPQARVRYHRPEFDVEVALDSHGLRNPERPRARPEGTFRVLALGDSFVEAFMVPLEATVTSVLENALQRPGCPVEVVNGGTSGYSTDQEYLFYRQQGHAFGAQVVVLFFYYNDVVYNGRERNLQIPKPLLAFDGSGAPPRVANEPVPERKLESSAPPAPPEHPEGSAALEWLADRLTRAAPRAYDGLARLGLWAPRRISEVSDEMLVYRRIRSPEVKQAWEQTGRILGALRREVEAHGARLVVAYVPSKMEVSDADWDLTRNRYALREDRWDRARVPRDLEKVCAGEGVPMLDLTPDLRAADGAFHRVYFERDSHWNARGQAVAARTVESWLRRQGWLPACAGAGLSASPR